MNILDLIGSFSKQHGHKPVIGFIGLGVSNRCILRRISDCQTVIRSLTAPDGVPDGARLISGDGYLDSIYEDILILSPSVRRDSPEIVAAAERGTVITSDAELFFEGCDRPVYAITGSDGKSTTATLTRLLLSEKHPDTELLGNIGVPFADSRSLDAAVAELSSFQLSYLTPLCRSAVITTLTPNHLNWHSSLEEYVSAKLNVLKNAERTVLSPDTALEAELMRSVTPNVIYSARYTKDELQRQYSAEHFITREDGYILIDGERWLDISLIKRREAHNVHNLMGAMGAALGEYTREHLEGVARGFGGLAHRIEILPSFQGVNFINSSIDTTPARVRATLESLDRPVRLIMGGRGKGLSYEPLIPVLRKYALSVSVYGEVRSEMLAEFEGCGLCRDIECTGFEHLREAIDHATNAAQIGDTVILSPAATGYGEFRDYRERGEYFKEYIKNKYKGIEK